MTALLTFKPFDSLHTSHLKGLQTLEKHREIISFGVIVMALDPAKHSTETVPVDLASDFITWYSGVPWIWKPVSDSEAA